MALGRYSTLAYSDPNQMPLVSLPFEAMDQVLAGYQQTKDLYESVEGLGFDYLTESPTDVALAGQVKQYQQDIGKQVTEVARSGDIGKYQQALKTGIRQLSDLRTPGGPVYALGQRKKQMAAARAELKERYDKLTDVNYDYAIAQLQPGDIGYNLDTGDYQQIIAPNVQDFIDVHKLVRDTAKAMVPAEEEISYIEGDYVWTKSGKQYYIAEAVKNLMDSPEVAEQMKISAWYKTKSLSPNQKKAVLGAAEDASIQNLTALNKASEQLDVLANSANSSDIRDLQNVLKELGFDPGPADGVKGSRTEAAINQAQAFMSSELENMKLDYTEDDLYGIVYNELKDSYLNYGRALRPDSYSRKIQMANWRAKLRAQRSAQQSLLQQFAVATQADLFPVPLPALEFDASKLEQDAIEAVQSAEATANTELAQYKDNGIFPQSETLETAVEKWLTLRTLKEEDPENYKKNFAHIYTNDDIDKANRMIQTLEFDNKGLVPNLRERARLKKTLDMISSENQVTRQTYAERGGEEIIAEAWKYVNDLASKGEVITHSGTPAFFGAFPEKEKIDIQSAIKGYSYKKFRDEFLSNPDGIPILGTRKVPGFHTSGPDFREKFNKNMEEDMGTNKDLYRSQINYGIKGDSEIFKKIQDVLGPVEASGYFQNLSSDALGNPATYMEGGKEVKVDMNGEAEVTIAVIGGRPVTTFTRKRADEKGYAMMTVDLSEVIGQNEFMQERYLELAAEAINNRNINDVITLLPLIQTEDPLESWAKQTMSPENQGKIGNFVVRNENGKVVQPVLSGAVYSVMSTDEDTGVSAIVARTLNGNKKYFNGVIDDKGDVNLVQDLSGEIGLPVPSAIHADNLVKLYKLIGHPKIKSELRKLNESPLRNVPPERRNEVSGINMLLE